MTWGMSVPSPPSPVAPLQELLIQPVAVDLGHDLDQTAVNCVALTGQFLPLFGKGVVLWGERAPRRVQADIDSTVVYRAAKLIRDDD